MYYIMKAVSLLPRHTYYIQYNYLNEGVIGTVL